MGPFSRFTICQKAPPQDTMPHVNSLFRYLQTSTASCLTFPLRKLLPNAPMANLGFAYPHKRWLCSYPSPQNKCMYLHTFKRGGYEQGAPTGKRGGPLLESDAPPRHSPLSIPQPNSIARHFSRNFFLFFHLELRKMYDKGFLLEGTGPGPSSGWDGGMEHPEK